MAWIVGIVGSLCIACVLTCMLRFKRCPPESILVVFGRLPNGETMKCLHGGGMFVWPLLQEYEYLSLEVMDIHVEKSELRTGADERVRMSVEGKVAITTDPAHMRTAAERLLGLQRDHIHHTAADLMGGAVKEMLAETTVDAINERPELFVGAVKERMAHELNKVGLELLELDVPRVEVICTPFVSEVRE